MRLLGPTLLEPYRGRIVNVHPSLLPAFPGKDAIGQALRAGAAITGVTVHYVDEGIDTGPAIAQARVAVRPDDTAETLAARVHAVEHGLYPAVVADLLRDDGMS
jgi:phosphoribosylglycinamide formyltransferase-1